MADEQTTSLNQIGFDPAAIDRMNPEEYLALITRLAREMPADLVAEARRVELRKIAGHDDQLSSFLAFYELIHGSDMVKHNMEALKLEFEAFSRGVIFLWLGFRGCRKTSTQYTIAAFLHGHHPDETGMITGANDSNAKLIAKSIAQIIENHPEFKACFPNVVVDKDRGWGAEGYWVRDNSMTREEWAAKMAKVNDPSLIGGGYKSSEINGKHPSLYLFCDDLHDIDSSASVTEREYIKQVFFAQILKTAIRENDKLKTRVALTGVPFADDDTYAVLQQTGDAIYYLLPVMRRAAEKAEGAVYIDGVNPATGVEYDDIKGWWYLTWEGNFGVKSIVSERAKGKSAFWQMLMLDIKQAKEAGLVYYLYDNSKISYGWITKGGADPTNVVKDTEVGGNKRSNFALCYLAKNPMGNLVVIDGVLKQCGIVEARDEILRAQTIFPHWQTTGVENVGGGAVFLQYLRTDPKVRVVDSNLTFTGKGKVRAKADRINLELSPWVESGIITFSDADTPYLRALKRLFDRFFDLDPSDEAWDAGDALYHAAKLYPEVLRVPDHGNSMNPQDMIRNTRRGLVHPMAFTGGIQHIGDLPYDRR